MTSASELRSGKTHRDENFPVASWIIHPRHRALILSFYNFVRTADDIADHATLNEKDKLGYLDLLEAELLGKGDSQPEAVYLRRDALAGHGASVEALGEARASAALLQCLHSLAARTEALLHQSKSLSAEVKDFRLGLEISVIQAFADKIVRLLKVRDPLSERVHLSPIELMMYSLAGVASEMTWRTVGRRPVSNPAAGA